jgi:type I restriction enzyme R subunit
MSTVGQIEKRTQARVVALFRERLNYDYLGDRTDPATQLAGKAVR